MTCRLDFDSAALRRPAASIREDRRTTTLLDQICGRYVSRRPSGSATNSFLEVPRCMQSRASQRTSNVKSKSSPSGRGRTAAFLGSPFFITENYRLQNPRTRLRGRFDGDMLSGEANVPTREVSWLCDITPQNFSTCQLMSLF